MEIASLSWAADWASYFKIEDLFECACVALNECGSPIEQLFLSALLVGKHGWKLLGLLESFDLTPGVPGGAIALHQAGLRLTQQFEAGPYRLDFAILPASSLIGIAIELDGHDFHERTKQQAQRDKARDRYLASQGWRVLRFTGSEVWRDPHKCASEATTIACSLTADRKELA
jgi:very-short-patch-repair endonuclease